MKITRLIFSLDLNKNICETPTPILKNYKLSMLLAKKQGYHIMLYGDANAIIELKDYYDEYALLNNVGGNNVWSEAKFEAVSREENFPIVHMDGDVFITDKLVIDNNADFYIDQFEKSTWNKYYSKIVKAFDDSKVIKIFPEWVNYNIEPSNIGIMGFKSKDVRDLYLDRYWKLNKFYKEEFEGDNGKLDGIPSMTIGQHSLSCIAKYHNLIIQEVTIKSEYLHMWGIRKYENTFQIFIDNFLNNLK